MDSFEMNKIIGAVLGTLLFVMGVGFLAEAIYAPIKDRGVGYALPEPVAGETVAVAEVEVVPLSVLLASASAERGAKVVRKCASCHNFEAGSGNKTGPMLYNTIGLQIASHDGFAYSDTLVGLGAEGKTWTYEAMDAFLQSPKGYAPGTKMTFAGLRSEKERADLLAYLQTLSDNPVPFPPVEEMAMDEPVEEEMAAETETVETE